MIESPVETDRLVGALQRAVSALHGERIRRDYWEQNECVFIEGLLPPELQDDDCGMRPPPERGVHTVPSPSCPPQETSLLLLPCDQTKTA